MHPNNQRATVFIVNGFDFFKHVQSPGNILEMIDVFEVRAILSLTTRTADTGLRWMVYPNVNNKEYPVPLPVVKIDDILKNVADGVVHVSPLQAARLAAANVFTDDHFAESYLQNGAIHTPPVHLNGQEILIIIDHVEPPKFNPMAVAVLKPQE